MYIPDIEPMNYSELREAMCDKAQEEDACIPTDEDYDCDNCILDECNIEHFIKWYRQVRAVQAASEVMGMHPLVGSLEG
jgi:hypothetical protein